LERALCHVEQCDEAALDDDRSDKPLQHHLVKAPGANCVRHWLLLLRCPSIFLEYSQHGTKRHDVAVVI
jgi:hypothetical protein